MISAFRIENKKLIALDPQADIEQADWVDFYRPLPTEIERAGKLGIDIPTLEDMEEIELSNRLYRTDDIEVLTLPLTGLDTEGRRCHSPVAFMIAAERFVTVRYHAPRPFETFPTRSHSTSAGCESHLHLFLGLSEEIISRLADLLEGVGKALDEASNGLFIPTRSSLPYLRETLYEVGRRGEDLTKFRLSLLSLERALSMFGLWRQDDQYIPLLKAQTRDIEALLVHTDFLSARVSHVTDVILGMVNVELSRSNRIISVVSVMFLPPTLVASVYGMNFAVLPGIQDPYGYVVATGLMIASAVGTLLYFKWKGWL